MLLKIFLYSYASFISCYITGTIAMVKNALVIINQLEVKISKDQ